ncbi:MAG: MFS transporter [Bacteroidales bacterium]
MNQKILSTTAKIRLTYLFAYGCAVCWIPVLSLYYQKAGLSGLEIGVLSAIPPAVILLVQPFWGFWADYFGRKKLLIIAMSGTILCFLLFPEKAGFWYLFFLTAIFGILWSTIHPLIDCITLDLFSKANSRVFSFYRMWGAIGWSAGSLFMYYINLSDNLVFNFRLGAILLSISMFFVLMVNPSKPIGIANEFEVKKESIKELWKNFQLIGFLVIIFFIAILTAPIWYYSSILYSNLGASSSLINLAYGLQGLVEIPFFFFANRIINRFGIQSTLIFTLLASSLRCFLYGIVQKPQVAICIEILQGISWSLLWACCVEYTNEIVPERWRATGQSLMWATFLGAGTILGNIWTGFLYESISIQTIYIINGTAILIFSILMKWLILMNKNKIKQDNPLST